MRVSVQNHSDFLFARDVFSRYCIEGISKWEVFLHLLYPQLWRCVLSSVISHQGPLWFYKNIAQSGVTMSLNRFRLLRDLKSWNVIRITCCLLKRKITLTTEIWICRSDSKHDIFFYFCVFFNRQLLKKVRFSLHIYPLVINVTYLTLLCA